MYFVFCLYGLFFIPIGIIVSSIITSVYSIGMISIDRFLYIVYGLQYERFISPLRARIMILSSWLLGKFPFFFYSFFLCVPISCHVHTSIMCNIQILVPRGSVCSIHTAVWCSINSILHIDMYAYPVKNVILWNEENQLFYLEFLFVSFFFFCVTISKNTSRINMEIFYILWKWDYVG